MKNPHRKRTAKLWRNSFIFVVLSAGVIMPPLALAVTFVGNSTIDRTDAVPGRLPSLRSDSFPVGCSK